MSFAAVGTSLAAVGGGSAAAGAMNVAGLGMGAYSLFSGSSSGSAPSSVINLTARGKKLEKATYKAADKRWADAEAGKLDDNLVSPIIANIRRQGQAASRQAENALSAGAAMPNTGETLASGNLAGQAVQGALQKTSSGYAPTAKKHELQRENKMNAMNLGQNIMNIETQTPMLRAQSMFTKGLMEQANSQQMGGFLGSLAQMGGMVAFNRTR
ncbi:MAG: hypothetical protein LLF76_02710 [Planctomycetaceae bacterium]|nr:hypothetical protein [Planctomycetaceae bacterium]